METTRSQSEQPLQPIATLQNAHREILIRAIANVLSTPIAKQTYAQIVDGLPLADVAWDRYGGCLCYDHPLLREHKELCPDVADEAERLCLALDVDALLMPKPVLRDYESAALGTPSFSTRLIELVARAVHRIAAWLFTQDATGIRHNDDALGQWRPAEQWESLYPPTFPTTLFCHQWYGDFDQYPTGIADSVGYWAEARILGGVVLFDRRDIGSNEDVEPNAIYVHPDRARVIYRICRLLESQTEELCVFLLATTPPQHCPLPILPGPENRQRVDPEQAIEKTGIYRDLWERRVRPLSEGDRRIKDVEDTFNYLSRQDWREAKLRGFHEMGKKENEFLRAQLRERRARRAELEAVELAGRP